VLRDTSILSRELTREGTENIISFAVIIDLCNTTNFSDLKSTYMM
jgi:hypothetical protein